MPSQDIVLGLYYLSLMVEGEPGEGMILGDVAEVRHALDAKAVSLHAKVMGRFTSLDEKGKPVREVFETTPGRMLLGQRPQAHLGTYRRGMGADHARKPHRRVLLRQGGLPDHGGPRTRQDN